MSKDLEIFERADLDKTSDDYDFIWLEIKNKTKQKYIM